MEPISHSGVVKDVSGRRVRVLVEQISACDLCRAKKFCTSADRREKIIDADSGGRTFQVGGQVIVTGSASLGLKAVLMAYVLPMLLMFVVLFLLAGWLFPEREALAALCSLGMLALYYMVLGFFRDRLKSRFVFTVRPVDEDVPEGLNKTDDRKQTIGM